MERGDRRETMSARTKAKERSREAILAAARAQFVARGYEATTIRDVARAAGVAVGSVHAHFKDKEALLLSCFFFGISAALRRIWADLDPAAPLLDQLTRCGEVLYEAYAAQPALSRVMLKATLFIDRSAAAAEDPLWPFLEGLAELFRRAYERGELRASPGDGRVAARGFFAVYLMTLIGGLSGAGGVEVEEDPRTIAARWARELRALVRLQLEGLGAPRGGEGTTL
jgi:AcrR family transcriptional regulator